MNHKKKLFSAFIFLIFFITPLCFAQKTVTIDIDKLPQLTELKTSRENVAFSEFNKIVEDNYKTIKLRKKPEMLFFVHTVTEEDKNVKFGFKGEDI